jgi:hypothetical protein
MSTQYPTEREEFQWVLNDIRAEQSKPTVEPEPCVWRADWREGRDGSILVPSCQPEMEIDAAFVQECVQLHGWKFCVHCGALLKVER